MISIIVPIYNIERYLKPCIESILNSTYKDFELILVDDGSTDGSGEICDRYAERDSRIKVIHKPNGGISDARNAGLNAAKGEYIQFVDGDDVIHPNMIQVLYDAIREGNYDFSMVRGRQVHEREYETDLEDASLGLKAPRLAISQDDMFKSLFGRKGINIHYVVVWNKLFKRKLVQDLKFSKTGSEDTEWTNRMCLRMNVAILVDAELYYWVQRQSSITHMGFNQLQVDRMNSYYLCLNEIPKGQYKFREWCLEELYKVVLQTRYNSEGTEYEESARSLASTIYDKTNNEFMNSDVNWIIKYAIMFYYHNPSLYRLFRKVCSFYENLEIRILGHN